MQNWFWEDEVRKIVLILFSFIVWMMLTWTWNMQHVITGVVLSIFIGLLFGEFFDGEPKKIFQPQRWFWALVYIPIFVWEMTKANFDVAYRVVWPTRPIDPGIVRVKTRIKSEMGKTFLANSITLTPGTLTVDLKDDTLYIHWIKVRSQNLEKATEIIIGRFEPILLKIID